MSQKSDVVPASESLSPISGLRQTNDEPTLGLKFIHIEQQCATREEVEPFVRFLSGLVEELAEARFDAEAGREGAEQLSGSPVGWRRQRYVLYPVYIERLEVLPTAAGSVDWTKQAAPLREQAPGVLAIPAFVLDPGSAGYFGANEAGWREHVMRWLGAETPAIGAGGFSFNALEIPAAALKSGEIDLRPACLHALGPDGSACDRGNLAAQGAIANAFWQTFWATGALRAERGATFPVAFLPIDRAHPGEFAGVFRERYVSLRRRLFGRTAIVGYVAEALTKARALLFNREANVFQVAATFDPKAAGTTAGDVVLAIGELNRTGFPDCHTGENVEIFAKWRAHEESGYAPVGLELGLGVGKGEGEGYGEASPETATRDPDAVLGRVHPEPSTPAEHLVRIHRVIPYAGCAYLREVVQNRAELEARGKLQGIEGQEIIAATNSTFFLNFPEEYATFHSAMNDPISLLVEDGRTLQIKTVRRAAFVLAEDGRALITTRAGVQLNSEALIFEGESSSASFADKASRSFRDNVFGPVFFGSVVVGDSIVECFEETTAEVPSNGWLIGDSEAFGGALDPRKAAEVRVAEPGEIEAMRVRHAFAVGPLLVEDGKPTPFGETREDFAPIVLPEPPSVEVTRELARTELPAALLDAPQRGIPPMRFPHDWSTTRAPRTAIGVKGDGSVLVVVADGRANLPHSVGASLAELARLMVNLGCVTAMNCDGGGSSVMFVNDARAKDFKLREGLADGVVNLPSDQGGVERLLPVPLLVLRRTAAVSG